ncbi:MAG TPA: TolC family protein [Caulobacteraceae bacterium]|jgi:outer membrane protein TolC
MTINKLAIAGVAGAMVARPASLIAAIAMFGGGAQAAPLTYDAALKLAETTAPSLEAKAADVRASQRAAVAAGRLPDPKASVEATDFPITGPLAGRPGQDDFSMLTFGVSQEVPNVARRRAARERAAADIGAAEVGQRGEARDVRVNTALAWINLYYAEHRLAVLNEIDRALASLRQTAASRLASGAARPGETLEPEQWTAALADRRAGLVAEIEEARAELIRWTGDPQAEVAGDPPDFHIDPAALRAGLLHLPALTQYDAMERQADADVDAAKADKHPDWGIGVDYSHRDPRFGDYLSAKVTFSLPLFASTRQDPIIDARVETAGRVRLERTAELRELEASLDARLADHVMHHELLERAQNTLVPLARQRADLESASYGAGSASLSDVLSALLALAEAQTEVVDHQADVARDGAAIVLTYGDEAQ